MTTKTLYALGETPPTGVVPKKMLAQVIRQNRFSQSDPKSAFQIEEVDVPELRPDEVLVWVMAAGVNYNNVWAAMGTPVDVIGPRPRDKWFPDDSGFHIGGSDASGIVWKVGSAVTHVKVGDEVVMHCGQWSREDPVAKAGRDPMFGPSFRIWGYETSWGSFAQLTKVQDHQCLPKPAHLSWTEAAAGMLVGATAYRMLRGWSPNAVQKDDVVLVWGGSGGLGSQAIQITAALGGVPIAVVGANVDKAVLEPGDDPKSDYCLKLGAKGVLNRKAFKHWGMLPHWKDAAGYASWLEGAKAFGAALWKVAGKGNNPRVVFEHPGEDTIPTSIFVCETGGMVVVCAGTTGFNATVDLRYLWMRQKRLQGSHFANDVQSREYNELVLSKKVDPCLSQTFSFEDIPKAHDLMHQNKHAPGNMACLVNAKE
jgi:crotonyl-CoA carboxylase/reductase